jgi:uncharacterized membrane protein
VSLSASWNAQSRGAKVMSVVLGLLILTAVVTLVYVARMPRHIETYTEFYLLNENGMAEDYPTSLKSGEEANVIIGITNHENVSVDYRVEFIFNGLIIDEFGPVTLDAEKNYEKKIKLTFAQEGEHQKLEFLLYKDAETETYETLHLWMNISGE